LKKIQARFGVQQCYEVRESLHFVYKAFQKARWACRCSEHRAVIRLGWHMKKTAAVGDFDFDFAGLPTRPSWQPISVKIEEMEEAKLAPPTLLRSTSPPKPETKKPIITFWKRQKHSTGDLPVTCKLALLLSHLSP